TSDDFRQKFPRSMGSWEDFWAVPLRASIVCDVKPALWMLSGAVSFVLLIGCANVAALLLARGQRRRGEIATRTALGARPCRLVRSLLAQSAALAIAGGALGLVFGAVGLRAILRLGADAIPQLARQGSPPPLDPWVAWFTAAIAAGTGILFGVAPALSTSRVDLSSAFREAGAPAESGWHRHRAQGALVTVEITLGIPLLLWRSDV